MLARTELRPGERVLELACGPGGVGLAAARLVAPGGEVVLSDVAAEMTAIAAARAEALGLGNVATRVLDLEDIDEPDAAYDAVLCREGLMFATDHARAAAELHRVLRPGGRAAISVWGPPERNPWLALVFAAVGEQIGRPVPPPGVPTPFSLGGAGALLTLLAGAGFADVRVDELRDAAPRDLVRAVVGADVRARRAAREDPRGACPSPRTKRSWSGCARPSRRSRRRPASSYPG